MTIDPRHRVPVADAPAGPRVMAAMEVDTVLALLECPVCLLPPRAPPIYQCRTGDPPPAPEQFQPAILGAFSVFVKIDGAFAALGCCRPPGVLRVPAQPGALPHL